MASLRTLLRRIVPLGLRKKLRDAAEFLWRAMPPPHQGVAALDLTPTQIYPAGRHFLPVLEEALIAKLAPLNLGRSTAVASIGTCFAEEFALFMRGRGYNYVITEPDALAASANWGRVYTVPNFIQILRYSFENDFPLLVESTARGFFDPLREYATPYYVSRQEALTAITNHRIASRAAFSRAAVLIVTVGQNEAWVDKGSGMVWARIPPRDILQARRADFVAREFSYEEVRDSLLQAIDLLRQQNAGLRILFTVSPVASYASFSDGDVVSQSFANKCLLRAAVHEVVRRNPECAFYFPSFEIVLCDNAANFRADNRHVKYSTVDRIFSILTKATRLGQS